MESIASKDTAVSAENNSLEKPHRLHGTAVFDGPTPVFGHLSLTSSERAEFDLSPPIVIFNRLNRTAQFKQHFLQKKRRFEAGLQKLYQSNINNDEDVSNGTTSTIITSSPSSQTTLETLTTTDQFIQQRESLKDLMLQYKNDFDELRRESSSFNSQKNAMSTVEDSSLSKSFRPNLPFSPLSQQGSIPQYVAKTKSNEQITTSNTDHKTTITLSNTMSTTKPAVCKENRCKNGAKCVSDKGEIDGFRCDCAPGWTGSRCEEVDHCIDHGCVGGECVNNNVNYTCECLPNYTGRLCTRDCGDNFCKHNGTCTEKRNGELGCNCPSGSAGKHCEREINECNFRHCKNAVKCIDKWNDYECVCEPGWMGKNCDRPCQDIYGSCKLWQRQGQCELMRYHTNFYDQNCAVSCEQCTANNSTALTKTPIPTTLLPLAWMLGVWKADVNGTRNNTIDFPFDFHSNGYVETLTISLQTPLMFGTPSINFTSIAISKIDPRDQHIMNGFLTIRNRPEETPLVAISSVSNSGTVLIEEGELLGTSMILKPRYQFNYPLVDERLPEQTSRTFLKNGKKLLQSINRKRADGRSDLVNKHYKKIEVIQYL